MAIVIVLAVGLSAGPTDAAIMEFKIDITAVPNNLQVNGTSITTSDFLYYVLEWDENAAKSSGVVPVGTANYVDDAIQAGGSLIFDVAGIDTVSIATNNATDTTSARKFEVKNSNAGGEDKWKTEAIFTDVTSGVNVTVGGANVSSANPEKIKIELKSRKVNFLSSSELLQATSELLALDLSTLGAGDRKFEMKWKGTVGGVKDPKITGEIVSMTQVSSSGSEPAVATKITAPTTDLQDGPPLETAVVSAFGDGAVGGLFGIWLSGLGSGGDPNYRWSISGGPEGLAETVLATLPDTDNDGAVDDYFLTFEQLSQAGALDRSHTSDYTLKLEALDSGGLPIAGSESEILLSVPEPATMGMLLVGSLALAARRRRRV